CDALCHLPATRLELLGEASRTTASGGRPGEEHMVLNQGDKNDAVRDLQRALNKLGALLLLDGDLGPGDRGRGRGGAGDPWASRSGPGRRRPAAGACCAAHGDE